MAHYFVSTDFQLFTRFLGGPIGGICWVASARNASAIKCGCVRIIDFQPNVSITSVACLTNKKPTSAPNYQETRLDSTKCIHDRSFLFLNRLRGNFLTTTPRPLFNNRKSVNFCRIAFKSGRQWILTY